MLWRTVQLQDYVIDFNRLAGAVTPWSVAYAVTYVQSETAQSNVVLKVGSNDQSKVYLNGRLIYECSFPRVYYDDQDVAAGVDLKAGTNVLVFKVVNELAAWLGSVRLTDPAGQPLKGIRVTLDPEGKD